MYRDAGKEVIVARKEKSGCIVNRLSWAANAEAKKTARGIYDDLTKFRKEKSDAFIYFQGMKSPIERAQDLFRYQILMRIGADHFDGVIDEIYEAADRYKNKKNTVFVEINPQNLN